jgi:hypothetical protein
MASVPGKKKWFATSAAIILSILMALTQKQPNIGKTSLLFSHIHLKSLQTTHFPTTTWVLPFITKGILLY